MKKRITSMVLLACMLFCACIGAFRIPADSAGMPSRVIHLVCDDSESMIWSKVADDIYFVDCPMDKEEHIEQSFSSAVHFISADDDSALQPSNTADA